MSERKSWDVQPKRPAAPAAPAPVAGRSSSARPAKSPKPQRSRAARSARPRRQRRARNAPSKDVQGIILGIFLTAVLIGGVYVAWMPRFRVATVQASGPDSEGVTQAAESSLRGTYFYLLPRDSIFFYSPNRMRAAVLNAYPDVAAVSIHRSSFTSVGVSSVPRETAFIWCGASIDTALPSGECYDADASGLVFASATPEEAQASSTLRVYGALDQTLADGVSPVRSHVVGAAAIPNALRFIKAIRGLGAPVTALALRGDEADLWLGTATRITYLLGHEEEAVQLAASAFPALTLTDHSIQYIDLRFAGKVYVKKYGQ